MTKSIKLLLGNRFIGALLYKQENIFIQVKIFRNFITFLE